MPAYHGDDGALLHYDVLGGSPTSQLMVLAGGAARHPDYLGDLAGLSEHHQLAVPHLRGVGRSSAADLGDLGSWWRPPPRPPAPACRPECTRGDIRV